MRILVYFQFTDDQIASLKELAAANGQHEVIQAKDEAEAIARAPEAEVILGHFPAAVCAAAPKLRWIQSFSAGMDRMLFAEIVERDVVITNMAGVYAPQGGEHAWAFLLALARGVVVGMEAKQRREWRGGPAIELTGGTLGVIGLGGFGLETVRRAQGYDMTVIALDPVRTEPREGVCEVLPPTHDNLISLLERSDAVVVTCPLTPETRHMIGESELAAMKESAYIVCVSRGGIIVESALCRALEEGWIAGAGLDVCEVEPLPPESPLWSAPNLALTPHCAGASQHRPRKAFEFFAANLERYLKGEELINIIDKNKGY